jgi:hypothetical protein
MKRLLFAMLLLPGCGHGVLPADPDLLDLSETEVREKVLKQTPIGIQRRDVERSLRRDFRKGWDVIGYESRELVAKHGFSIPVSEGDYYFRCDFAPARTSPMTARVLTVHFLFDHEGNLRDVSVLKWHDGP